MASPSPSVAGEFLAQLYAPLEEGWLTLFTIDRRTGDRNTEWSPVTNPGALALSAELHRSECVWFGMATRKERLNGNRRGRVPDCLAIPGLWVDVDVAGPNHRIANLPADHDEALDLVERFPQAPTVIVDSGGGLQAFWAFAEPLLAEEAIPLLVRWGATWAKHAEDAKRHIDNVFNVDRIMRLPGTFNTKSEPYRFVEMLSADWTLRYGVDDLDEWMVDPPKGVEALNGSRPLVPYIGPERPGDAYNARHSCAELLSAAGFEAHRPQRNGDQNFKAPGASNDVGATVYAEDGHATIWSETFAASRPGIEVRHPYTPFGLYILLEHDGDASRAARELRQQGYGAPMAEVDLERLAGGAALEATSHPTAIDVTSHLDHGWHPADVAGVLAEDYAPPAPDLFARKDGALLLYRGRVNALHGESGSGKSWIAQAAAAQALTDGESVLYVDLEDHLSSVVARLLALGVPRDIIVAGFDYIAPEGFYGPAARFAVEQRVLERKYALVVIDSTGEAMALDAAKQNDDDAVAQWFRKLPRALAELGPAVVVIDHVPKATDAPRLFAIGSQRKRAAIDGVAYRVEARVHPAKGKTGYLSLIVAKDRNGHYQTGSKVANITITSSEKGDRVEVELAEVAAVERPTVLMERVSMFLEDGPARSKNSIEQSVTGKRDYVRDALRILVEEGFVGVHDAGQGLFHHSIRPYRQDDDELQGMVSDVPK